MLGATVALGVFAYIGGRTGRPWLTALAISVAFTAAWSLDAATTPTDDANLWPVGAVLTFVGTLLGTLVVAVLARRRSRRRGLADANP